MNDSIYIKGGCDGVIEWLRINCRDENMEFEVRGDGEDSNTIFCQTDGKSFNSFDDKLRYLEDNFALGDGRRAKIIVYKDKSQKQGRKSVVFDMVNSTIQAQPVQTIGAVPEGMISRREVELLLEEERRKYREMEMERELAELRKENKELRSPINEFMRNLSPIAGTLISKLIPGQQASPVSIGKIDTSDEIEVSTELTPYQITELFEEWKQNDPEFMIVLQKIVSISGSPMYNQAKGILMTM